MRPNIKIPKRKVKAHCNNVLGGRCCNRDGNIITTAAARFRRPCQSHPHSNDGLGCCCCNGDGILRPAPSAFFRFPVTPAPPWPLTNRQTMAMAMASAPRVLMGVRSGGSGGNQRWLWRGSEPSRQKQGAKKVPRVSI